ncbi:hypothetical protein DSO57_1026208 [Entomophthora muscae]|uniref:Uncharacterized protein n=1 Tax=Entomophthora muscae TaxID=34485 RepID=A0ACC2T2F5_9FUNG|nr:hypothetical protein DSO57_1026208 [Entomophthora muscae]
MDIISPILSYFGYIYGHAPIKGVPLAQFNQKSYERQLLEQQGKVETSNMILPDMKLVKDFIWYSALNACSSKQLINWDCRDCANVPTGEFVTSFRHLIRGTHGYIAIDHASKRIICSFRGLKYIRTGLQELFINRKPYVYANNTNVTVSTGFYDIMESMDFVTPLKKLVNDKQYKDYKLAFVGHSLGGSLASLALPKVQSILNLDWKRLELYTYGQPRTGNSDFARWYNNKTIASARVVNHFDPVPLILSTTFTDYRHHFNEIWIQGPPDNYTLTICSNDQLEDTDCSYKLYPNQYSEKNHYDYFGLDLAREC